MRLRRVCEQKNANEESRRAGTLAMSRSFFFHFFLIDYTLCRPVVGNISFSISCAPASGGVGGDKIARARSPPGANESGAETIETSLKSREGNIRAFESARMVSLARSRGRLVRVGYLSLSRKYNLSSSALGDRPFFSSTRKG